MNNKLKCARDMDAMLDLLREFRDDVKAAYGTGKGDELDPEFVNPGHDDSWPDLAITYRKVVKFLRERGE